MRRTLRKVRHRLMLAVALLSAALPAALADDYGDARDDLVAAYEAADYDAMEDAAQRALAARPGYPDALFNLALAEVLNDKAYAGLATLGKLAELGVDYEVDAMEEFYAVRTTPGWADYADRMTALAEPVGVASVAYRHDVGDFVPEGIAIDSAGTLYLGSIRKGDIVRIEADADAPSTSVASASSGHWSVYGMRLVGDTLWFVSSAVEQFSGLDAADAGKNGLFAIDIHSGVTELRAMLPENGGWQVLGDLAIDDNGIVYLADQTDGLVYRFDPASPGFSPVIEQGVLRSPQGIVIADAATLYVADYVGGLFHVDIETGTATPLAAPGNTSLYGIDGLYAYGDSLIAIQNGIRPSRVVRLKLGEDGRSVSESRILAMNLEHFDEPNLGQVVGNQFYFIANSHWNRFDRDGNLPDGLKGPIVLRIDLKD